MSASSENRAEAAKGTAAPTRWCSSTLADDLDAKAAITLDCFARPFDGVAAALGQPATLASRVDGRAKPSRVAAPAQHFHHGKSLKSLVAKHRAFAPAVRANYRSRTAAGASAYASPPASISLGLNHPAQRSYGANAALPQASAARPVSASFSSRMDVSRSSSVYSTASAVEPTSHFGTSSSRLDLSSDAHHSALPSAIQPVGYISGGGPLGR